MEPYVQLRLSPFELGLLMGLISRQLGEDPTSRVILGPLWERMKEKALVFYQGEETTP